MTFWLFSGWDQKSGDEICSSVLANSFIFWDASKIAPHGRSLFPERRVFAIKFFEGHCSGNLILARPTESACSRRTKKNDTPPQPHAGTPQA
jgi:hypothetical protein